MITKYPGYPPYPPREGGLPCQEVDTCTTCRATTQGWSTTHGIWIPGVPGHPSRIYPGSLGNRSGSHRNQLFPISGDPGCQDAKKPKKLSRITFFVFRALFSVQDTFFCPGALFSVPEHFFSGIGRFPMVDPGNSGIPVFLRKRRKLVNFRKFLRFLGIPGHPEFFSPEHPQNPGVQEKTKKVQNLAPHAIYI